MLCNITDEEIFAVKYYLGDPDAAGNDTEAYNTINALLHPGTANEADKAAEGRYFGLSGPEELRKYLSIAELVFRAAEKYRAQKRSSVRRAYRIDRKSSFERFLGNGGKIAGFFSSCSWGFLPEYAAKKKDIVLIESAFDESLPFIDLAELLKDRYAKPEEAEILIPFGTRIVSTEAQEMGAEEQEKYRDMAGNLPAGKYLLRLTRGEYQRLPQETEDALYAEITDEFSVGLASVIMEEIRSGADLSEAQRIFYCSWKEKVISYVNSRAAAALDN
ncbi:MAG: hypothetical protein K5637_05090 [Lachnospiraceae bacterium]|nr:hypothetical protein [Lachnospiraceae bacterium]